MKSKDVTKDVIYQELDTIKQTVQRSSNQFQTEVSRKLALLASSKESATPYHLVRGLLPPKFPTSSSANQKPHLVLFEPSLIGYTKECLDLLKDLTKGKLNALLQEALHNAEVSISIKKRDPDDPKSRQVLSLNIEIAATIIDKYASLLGIVLKQTRSSKDESELIQDSKKVIHDSTERWKHLSISLGILKLKTFSADYVNNHTVTCHLFEAFFSRSSQKKSAKLVNWLENLVNQPLSANELIGAVYYVRTHLDDIHNTKRRDALRDGLDKIVSENTYPRYLQGEKDKIQPYLIAFLNRVKSLDLSLPFSSKTVLKSENKPEIKIDDMVCEEDSMFFMTIM